MIAYPSNLPQPATTLSGDVATPTIRTDIPNGLAVQEGRFSTGRETYALQWTLSEAEFSFFEEWFAETLAGGVLVFGLLLPSGGTYAAKAVRFIGGNYDSSHKGGLWWNVTASVELMGVYNAPANRTPPVPQFIRLAVDPTASQALTLSHRNALLTVRPDSGSTTTLRVFPPTDPTAWIYFGISNQGLGETLITSQDVDPPLVETVQPFPGGLPNINQQFGLKASRRAVRAEMESGHVRQFTASKSTQKTYQVEWEFSLAQLQTFQDFFFVTLKSGAASFTLTLPVDGQFISAPVRFVGGKYSESYVATDRFKISATLERTVDQTILPTEERPFPMYYGPTVNVAANRKITLADAGKFFVVTPAAGQTISLHIYSLTVQFGLLIKGLGNVLITRGPFIFDLGTLPGDFGASEFLKTSMTLRDTILNLGTVPGDSGASDFMRTSFSLVSTAKNLGTVPEDSGASNFMKPQLDLVEVLADLGTVADGGSSEFLKTTIELIIP